MRHDMEVKMSMRMRKTLQALKVQTWILTTDKSLSLSLWDFLYLRTCFERFPKMGYLVQN